MLLRLKSYGSGIIDLRSAGYQFTMTAFDRAKSPFIVRADQTDSAYLSTLRASIGSLTHKVAGPRGWIRWQNEIHLAADLAYFMLTTYSGYQTLGEEYVNIVQVDPSETKIPSKLRRLVMIMGHVLVPYVLEKQLRRVEQRLENGEMTSLGSMDAHTVRHVVSVCRTALVYGHRLHLVLFYFSEMYYHVAKRAAGVRYLHVRPQQQANTPSFQLLGWLGLLQVVGTAAAWVYKARGGGVWGDDNASPPPRQDTGSYVPPSRRCPLCLESRQDTTCGPCGHVFCWTCILSWCATKPECPLCRDHLEPSKLVKLLNFDAT